LWETAVVKERVAIERAVISSLMLGGNWVQALCEEFDLKPKDFTSDERADVFMRVMSGRPLDFDIFWQYRDFVPTAANGRYYVEMLYELVHGART
jgi:hypothetical protein